MPAFSDAILAPFEDPNAFAVLQPFHEESITDIEVIHPTTPTFAS